MTYWRLFYHIVWATKNREPLIQQGFEADLWRVLVGKATDLGALVHAVGGVEDHVHVVASVPPKIALSEFVQQLKGSSSHFVSHRPGAIDPFAWQPKYGVLSFDGKQLDQMVKYVRNQREHHRGSSKISILEKSAGEPRGIGDK